MKLKIKGINDVLLMTLPNLSWDQCCQAVRETIGDNVGFYAGANLFLDAGDLDIRVVEITSLRNELEKNPVRTSDAVHGADDLACARRHVLRRRPTAVDDRRHVLWFDLVHF